MKFLDEYRDVATIRRYLRLIDCVASRPWTLMEVCGGQTHSILKHGLDRLLPDKVRLLHGPGCPVCVTPVELLDRAIQLATQPHIALCTFGDMLRVPGSRSDLLTVKAQGADIRMVYSPLDAVRVAQAEPQREVILFAVGFETTAPATALAVQQAAQLKLSNFRVLCAHVRVPPALRAILQSPDTQVQGFLAAGHVCAVTGYDEYQSIAEEFQVPIVVTGFEPVDLLAGIYRCVRELEAGRCRVLNEYRRVVLPEGNPTAREAMRTVFRIDDRRWRGFGVVAEGGLYISERYSEFDAERSYSNELTSPTTAHESNECMSALVLQGRCPPQACPAFAKRCTPDRPLGATMVSSEGACHAYYRYRFANGSH